MQRSGRTVIGVRLHWPPTHPAMPGHFPGLPVVPGALLLGEALLAAGAALGADPNSWRVLSAKFPAPVGPGEAVDVTWTTSPANLRLVGRAEGRVVLRVDLSTSGVQTT